MPGGDGVARRIRRRAHRRLTWRLRPPGFGFLIRDRGQKGLRTHTATAQLVCSGGHAFVQNLRRGHYELGFDTEPGHPIEASFTELSLAI